MPGSSLVIGAAAPPFALEAVVTRRRIGPATVGRTPLLLVFQSYQTVDPARHLIVALRRRYPDPHLLLIANLVDGRVVPKLMRSVAMGIMSRAYEQAAAELPADEDPADHLVFLLDWSGKVFRAYGFADVSERIGVALIDQAGLVYDTFHGEEPLPVVFGWLENLGLPAGRS